jgi:hypothetical protein
VKGVQAESELQGLVDTYISTHSADSTFLSTQPVADGQDKTATRATFFLELGLRSFAGANFQAALARLESCREQLLAMVDAQGASSELSSQLGAVCGSQGDCFQRLNDPKAAEAKYQASIQHLEACLSPTHAIKHELTVTLNKLGDLWYRSNNLAAAHDFYDRALQQRRAMLGAADGGTPSAQLNVALSLAKIADLEEAMGKGNAAAGSLQEAKSIAATVEARSAELDTRATAQLQALNTFLAAA